MEKVRRYWSPIERREGESRRRSIPRGPIPASEMRPGPCPNRVDSAGESPGRMRYETASKNGHPSAGSPEVSRHRAAVAAECRLGVERDGNDGRGSVRRTTSP